MEMQSNQFFPKNRNTLWNNALYCTVEISYKKFFDPHPGAEDLKNLIIMGVFREGGANRSPLNSAKI